MKRFLLRPSLAWLRPEAVIYIALGIFSSVFLVLYFSLDQRNAAHFTSYILGRGGNQMLWAAVILGQAFLLRLMVLWIRAGMKGMDPTILLSRQSVLGLLKSAGAFSKNLLFIGVPFVLSFYALTTALGQLNIFNSTRLRDELLFRWDVLLTHTFPPLSLAALEYPVWFIQAVDFSFSYLVIAFALFGAYLFCANQKLFREAAVAFSLASLVGFAGWILFPVLSPHDRFIDNVYELPILPEAQAYVQAYHPQEGIRSFLERMRESKKNLDVLPTSTFPSAHVFWAVLFAYYAWRLHKWLIVFALPLAVLSSIGTFLFAQHYFVDVPAGILVALLSIWVASLLMRRQIVWVMG